MRYLNPLRYIHYHTQLAIPTIYDDSLSFYEIMNKTNLHFNEVINDMNENYEIIDKAFQEVLEQTNKWMEEAKAQADRAEQEANKSQASAEDAKNQADRAKSEADAAAASAVEAKNQADRASSEADRAHTEAENAKAQAQAAANSAQESATSATASAGSASESAASATESKKSADASAASATESKNSADASANSASQSAASATASQNSAEASANSASQSAASAVEAKNQADRASSEADRAHTEAENAKAQAQAAANSAQESATSATASAGSASESAASATESKKSADASAASATESKNSADASANSASQSAASATASQNSAEASANSASQSAASATASQNSAEASANSASQAAQSATDAANSAKDAADTLDEAKKTFVKKAGDTMSGKLTISYGGLSVDGSADISGDLNTGRLQVGKPDDHRDTHLYGNLYLNDMLNMSIGSNVALKFANLQDGLKLYAPLSFEPSPLRISNVGNPQNDFDAVNKITLDSKVTGINAELTDVNNQIAALTTRMGTAEKNITKNTSDIASLTNRVTTNETSINNINTEITNIKQDITTVEGDYVKKAGDTMTGNLTMGLNQIVMDTGHIVGGNNTLLFEGYPLIDVDGAKISMVANPAEAMDAANKEYVDNAVAGVKPTGDYLPLTGGKLSGNLLMGTGTQIHFEEGVHLAYATDFGFDVQTNGGSVGIVSNNIVHTDTPIAADSKLITYSISDVSIVPGTTVKQYNCDGTGFQQMRFSGFRNVKFASSLLVDEDPVEDLQVATKRYVDQHSGGGGEVVPLDNNLVCYISEIGNGIYNCDCYLIKRYNIVGTITADKYSFEKTISHNLNEYLNSNNYSRIGDTLETFIYITESDSLNLIIITGRLRESSLTIKVSKTTINTTVANVDKYVNVGKVGSMLLRKNI